MFDYCFIDTFSPSSMTDYIESVIVNGSHWQFSESTIDLDDTKIDVNDTNIKHTSQFTSLIYADDRPVNHLYSSIIVPLFWMLESKTGLQVEYMQRIKANLLVPNGSSTTQYNPPHIDYGNKNYMSMVYYVNESDGDTRLFNESVSQGNNNLSLLHSQPPKKGSAIIFPSTRFHSSSNPINYDNRCVINLVFTVTNDSFTKFLKSM